MKNATLLADIRLAMSADASNVVLARRTIDGVGDVLGIDEEVLDDVRIAVTEAVTNVVLHAYEDDAETRPLGLAIVISEDTLAAVVQDTGCGIATSRLIESDNRGLGLGLSLAASLATKLQVSSEPGLGTRVVMAFSFGDKEEQVYPPGLDEWQADFAEVQDGPLLSIVPGSILEPVLTRISATMAGLSDVVLDRVEDVKLVAGEIAAATPDRIAGKRVRVQLCERPGWFELKVGPLTTGGGESLLGEQLATLGNPLRHLADQALIETDSFDGSTDEFVRIGVATLG